MRPSLFTNRFLFQIFHDFNFLELVLRRLAVLLLSDFLNKKKIISVAFFELTKLYLEFIRSTLKKSVDAKVSRVQLSGIPWMWVTFLLFLRKRDILWWEKKNTLSASTCHSPFHCQEWSWQNFFTQLKCNIKQTWIKKNIDWGDFQFIQYQILQTSIIRIVCPTVRRIWLMEWKGLVASFSPPSTKKSYLSPLGVDERCILMDEVQLPHLLWLLLSSTLAEFLSFLSGSPNLLLVVYPNIAT